MDGIDSITKKEIPFVAIHLEIIMVSTPMKIDFLIFNQIPFSLT